MTLVLRGHHLNGAKLIHTTPKHIYIDHLIQAEYVESSDHPFIDKIYELLKNTFKHPLNKIKLVVGKLDIICESCKELTSKPCSLDSPLSAFNAFTKENTPGQIMDSDILKKYGFKENHTYTVREIRKRMEF